MTDTPDDIDLLAAEYVLGVLPPEDRATVERRARNEPAVAASIAAWEARLAGMNDEIAEVAAPDLIPAIEARLWGTPAAKPRYWWRFALGGVLAAALGVAVVALLPTTAPLPTLGTTLTADAQPLRYEASYAAGDLTLTRVAGGPADAGRVHELWLIVGDAAPVSLGLLEGPSFTTALPDLAPGAVLAVTLEPAGGAPGGNPTGPILVSGTITNL